MSSFLTGNLKRNQTNQAKTNPCQLCTAPETLSACIKYFCVFYLFFIIFFKKWLILAILLDFVANWVSEHLATDRSVITLSIADKVV